MKYISVLFFGSDAITLAPCELKNTLKYNARQYEVIVDSECGPAMPMMITTDTPGRYIGLGTAVVNLRDAAIWGKL